MLSLIFPITMPKEQCFFPEFDFSKCKKPNAPFFGSEEVKQKLKLNELIKQNKQAKKENNITSCKSIT
jgi:hypothetical protein